jgi:PAS domain S-box-containing protein
MPSKIGILPSKKRGLKGKMKTKIEQFTAKNPNPVLSVEKDGTVLYSNVAGEPLLHEWGVRVGEKLPSFIGDFVQRVISLNLPEKMEVKAGKRVYLVTFHPLPEEKCVNIYGFDISDQKEFEEKLRESENKYRNIVKTSAEGIWIFNSVSETTYVNEKMAEMLGYKPEEMIGRFIWDFAYEEDKGIFQVKLANRKQGIDEVYELKLLRKDGSPLWVSVSAKGFFDDAGKFAGSVGMFTDITRRKQEEHRIRRYNRILEGINRIFSNVVQAKTEEELGEACLSVALEVTGSQFGFINEMGADGLLHDVAKSELGWEQCLMYDKTGHRRPPGDFVVHGLYGSVIINEKSFFANDPQSHPDSIGVPPGHPALTSFLGVPLVQNGKTVGLIAVANRERGYSCEQQEDLEAIAPAVTQALQRKKAEEALRLSNIYNRSLIEASLDPLVTIRPDGKITDVNGAAEQVTGYSRNKLIGTDFSDYFTEPEEARTGYQQVFANGEVRNYPLEIQHKDGHITPILYNASVYRDENGKVIGVFAAARDITERQKAEEALRESEKRERARSDELAVVLDAVPVAVYITHDPHALKITGNRLSCEWQKVPLGTNFSKSAPEGERPEMFSLFRDGVEMVPEDMPSQMAAAGREIDNCELDIVSTDGKIRHVLGNARSLRDEQGNLRGSISAFIDITERKRAETKLKETLDSLEKLVEERTAELKEAYNSLLENELRLSEAQKIAHVGNWDWNLLTDELYWSDELYSIFGLTPQKFGLPYNDVLNYIHPDNRDDVDNAVKKAFKGKPYNIDYRIVPADGAERIVHAQGEIIFNDENTPVKMKGILQDITERKKAEEKIQYLGLVTK